MEARARVTAPWLLAGAVLTAVVPAALLLGCQPQTGGSEAYNPTLYRDAETGCEYVSATGRGITPRMDRDGKQICRADTPKGK